MAPNYFWSHFIKTSNFKILKDYSLSKKPSEERMVLMANSIFLI